MTYGTSHFVNYTAAFRYYLPYEGNDRAQAERAVCRKIDAGEIHIGAPELKPGERLTVIDDETRYAITTEEK